MQGPSQYGSTLTIPYGATNTQPRIVIDGNRGAILIYGAGSSTVANATIVQRQVIPNALNGSFGNPTTPGNAVIVCINAFQGTSGNSPNVTGVTLGGSGTGFSSVIQAVSPYVGDYFLAAIWANYNVASASAIVVSGTFLTVNANFGITLYEVNGLLQTGTLDKTSFGTNAGGTSWTSGATGTTTDAYELWIGNNSSNGVNTPPGLPWINEDYSAIGECNGYQIVNSTGTATYAGTQTVSGPYATVVATFKSTGVVRPNLRDSIAASGGTDPFGNPYPPDFTSFFPNTPGVYVNLSGASVLFMQLGSNQQASIGSSIAGVLLLQSGLVNSSDTISELFLSSSVANSNTTPLVDILVTGGNLAVNGTNMTVP
jgi:hypothetical protein